LDDAPLAGAFRAGVLDRLAASLACRAGPFDREEPLAGAHLPVAAAHGAGHRLRSWLGAAAGAIAAGNRRRHPDLRRLAGIGLLQCDLHIVAQVRAAFAATRGTAATTAHHIAEYVFEYVRESAGCESMAAAVHAAILECCMTETVVGGALLRILQRLVGFVDFLELVLARVVAGIAVRMELHGKLAERNLEFLLVRALLDAKGL